MSAINDSVSAYAAPKQSWAGALWADKARLRRVLMIWGVGIFLAVAGAMYLYGGRYVGSDDSYVHAAKLMEPAGDQHPRLGAFNHCASIPMMVLARSIHIPGEAGPCDASGLRSSLRGRRKSAQ